jgi:uncharacterized membrane protein
MEAGAVRIPGGKPVAIVLGLMGLAATVVTIVLSTIPAEDDPHPVLAVVKVIGLTALLLGAGVVAFAVARLRQRAARAPAVS